MGLFSKKVCPICGRAQQWRASPQSRLRKSNKKPGAGVHLLRVH